MMISKKRQWGIRILIYSLPVFVLFLAMAAIFYLSMAVDINAGPGEFITALLGMTVILTLMATSVQCFAGAKKIVHDAIENENHHAMMDEVKYGKIYAHRQREFFDSTFQFCIPVERTDYYKLEGPCIKILVGDKFYNVAITTFNERYNLMD